MHGLGDVADPAVCGGSIADLDSFGQLREILPPSPAHAFRQAGPSIAAHGPFEARPVNPCQREQVAQLSGGDPARPIRGPSPGRGRHAGQVGGPGIPAARHRLPDGRVDPADALRQAAPRHTQIAGHVNRGHPRLRYRPIRPRPGSELPQPPCPRSGSVLHHRTVGVATAGRELEIEVGRSECSRHEADQHGFVVGIFVSLFVFFNSFALNQWLQYRQVGPWRSYAFGEKAYLVLSLVAKSALAWQIFAGSLAS